MTASTMIRTRKTPSTLPVGPGERRDATHDPLGQLLLDHRVVASQRPHETHAHAAVPASAHSHSHAHRSPPAVAWRAGDAWPSVWPAGPWRRPAAAHARAALAQDAEQVEELVPLGGVEAAEDLLGAVAPGRLEAVEQATPVVAERHEDRPAVTGVGVPGDEPGRLEGVDHGGDRAGHHVELGGEVGHPQGPAVGRHEPQHPGLGIGEPQGGELDDRPPPQPAGGVGEQLGQLERGVRAGRARDVWV